MFAGSHLVPRRNLTSRELEQRIGEDADDHEKSKKRKDRGARHCKTGRMDEASESDDNEHLRDYHGADGMHQSDAHAGKKEGVKARQDNLPEPAQPASAKRTPDIDPARLSAARSLIGRQSDVPHRCNEHDGDTEPETCAEQQDKKGN